MKTKLLLLVLFLAFATSVVTGQNKPFKFGGGVMLGIPVGDMSDVASMAFALDLQGDYIVTNDFALTLSAGYLDWALKNDVSGKWGLFPVLVGGKYNITNKVYGSFQTGISFFTESGIGNAFTWAPGIGIRMNPNLDILIKYQSASKNDFNYNLFGVRAGLTF
jgi:hypothetical protein